MQRPHERDPLAHKHQPLHSASFVLQQQGTFNLCQQAVSSWVAKPSLLRPNLQKGTPQLNLALFPFISPWPGTVV